VSLNPKRARFVQEYLIDLNATQAAIRAGYSKKTAEQLGYQLLQNPSVSDAIAKAQAKLGEKNDNLVQRVIDELKILAFSDIQNYVLIDNDTGAIRAKGFEEMPAGASRALQTIDEHRAIKEDSDGNKVTVYDKVNFKVHDKPRALEMLGRHLGMFPNKIEGNLNVAATLTFAFGDNGNGKGHE
jgi:phage terminase small subunit